MIDRTKIGERVGAGLQHIVYAYGDAEVIKLPRAWMRFAVSYEQKKKRMEIVREYFAEYMLETKVYLYNDSYCYIQKRVFEPDFLRLREIGGGTITDLLRRDKEIRKRYRMSIDFVGSQALVNFVRGLFSGGPMQTGNIVMDPNAPHGMYLMDDDLMKASPFCIEHPREVLYVFLSYLMFLANRFLIRLYRD